MQKGPGEACRLDELVERSTYDYVTAAERAVERISVHPVVHKVALHDR